MVLGCNYWSRAEVLEGERPNAPRKPRQPRLGRKNTWEFLFLILFKNDFMFPHSCFLLSPHGCGRSWWALKPGLPEPARELFPAPFVRRTFTSFYDCELHTEVRGTCIQRVLPQEGQPTLGVSSSQSCMMPVHLKRIKKKLLLCCHGSSWLLLSVYYEP